MSMQIKGRAIGPDHPPFVIAEIGINHEGSLEKAHIMIDAAANAGAECVKFQTHIPHEEMTPNDLIPDNANETIMEIIERCTLSAEAEAECKRHCDDRGLIFISTPFSFAAVDRLEALGVPAYKIGSGECNNDPFLERVAETGKPVILSTGMNDLDSVRQSVDILRRRQVPFALMHCTSVYPTPPHLVRLGAIKQLADAFPDAIIGLSDHSENNFACYGAIALGASIIERHFTGRKDWPGPDIPVSMDPDDLREMIAGARTIFAARGGTKSVLPEEAGTIRFAFASVVTALDLPAGTVIDRLHITTRRPGTGDIRARDFEKVLGRRVRRDLPADYQLRWTDFV